MRLQAILVGAARLELFLVLQHNPMGILRTLVLLFFGLVRAEQHNQRGSRQNKREQNKTRTKRHER